MNILLTIQKLFDKIDMPCSFEEANDDVPYDRLIIALESPHHKEQDLYEVTARPQSVQDILEHEKSSKKSQDSYYLIQIQNVLPIEILVSTFNQVSSSIHFFNRILHCPGFELDELNDRVVYRYVWFIKQNGIDAILLKQVIGNIQLCINLFGPYIKEIAEGKYGLEDILQQVIEITKHQKK